MPRDLDPFTWFVATCLCSSMSAWLFWGLGRLMPAYSQALRAWSLGMACAAAAFILMAVRVVQSHDWLLFLSNLMLFCMVGGIVVTFRHLHDRGQRSWSIWWLGVGALTGPALHEAGMAGYDVAVFTVSLGMGSLLAWAAWLAWRLPGRGVASITCALTSGLLGASLLGRAVVAAQSQSHPLLQAGPTPEMQAVLLFGLVWLVAASLGVSSYVYDRHQQDVVDAARRDGLTGLLTRKAFMELAEPQLQRCGGPVSVVMVDIDHFKSINDSHGHAVGDQVIAHVARLLSSTVRLSDLVGRYGGEEFCMVLPHCDEAQAADLAWRLVREAGRRPLRQAHGPGLSCTLSAGFAQARPGESLLEVINRADQALYQAKRQGRNQACAASPSAALGGEATSTPTDSPFRGLSQTGAAG